MDDSSGVDICRVCRSEGLPERPLFHPCICTGSIKWIHQECLVQWMRYSRNEYCELCSHRFSFTPIYSPDMPRRLPLRDVVGGLLSSVATALKYWFHYALVAFAWLGLVPLIACRIYRFLFSGSIITLPFDMLTTENILSDVLHGCFVVTCTLFAFLGMLWLREQIVHGGGPDWLEADQEAQVAQQQQPPQQQQQQLNQPESDTAPVEEDGDVIQLPADDNNINTNDGNVDSDKKINFHGNDGIDGAVTPSTDNASNSSNKTSEDSNGSGSSGFSERGFGYKVTDNGPSGSCSDENIYLEKVFNNHLSGCDDHELNEHGNDDDFEGNSSVADGNDYNSDVNIKGDDSGIRADHLEEHENVNEVLIENQEVEPENEVAEEEVQGGGPEAGVEVPEGAENAQDDGNWNPIEWDRAVEELTWERLLGLDGSLVFLEHVLWVMALNTLFIFFFAFLPYHFGNLAITGLGLREKTVGTHFEGLITTLCGYCILGLCLVILRTLASLLGFQRSKRILGLCYVILKVSLLSVIDIGVVPLICGWWLDICTLSMFDATLKDRETTFRLAPGTSMFIHWLVGMVYVYYSANFILLLREVVRPGVLWFLNYLNDPDFSPIQEMIHTPIIHHIRRLLVVSIISGSAVLLMLWFPVLIIRYLWPTFLPYAVALHIGAQMNELSLELLLFQVILPSLLEQSHTRIWMKGLIRLWCRFVAWLFGIHSYLLGDESDQNTFRENNDNNNQGVFNGLGDVHHQALLPREGPVGVQPYVRPSWFYARLIGLLISVCISLIVASLIALTLPVWIGRQIMSFWLASTPNSPVAASPASAVGEEVSTRVHELYTAACGTYLCWLIARAVTLLRSRLPQVRAAILDVERMKQWCLWGAKSLIAFVFLLGIIPLLFGLLLELVAVVPVRVPIRQTPILFVWQDWALGVLYTKIACAVIMMGPNSKIKRAIERVYRDGIRNMDLAFILSEVAIPVSTYFSLALAVPYATVHSILPLIISDVELKNLVARCMYPCLLLAFIVTKLVAFQIRQFKKLYEHIKNDKYLVGKRLVNYDHRRSKSSNT